MRDGRGAHGEGTIGVAADATRAVVSAACGDQNAPAAGRRDRRCNVRDSGQTERRSWAFAAMDHSDDRPLTLCYLTVPRDPQSIVPMQEMVCRQAAARREARGDVRTRSAPSRPGSHGPRPDHAARSHVRATTHRFPEWLMSLLPLERSSPADAVVEALRDEILGGAYLPGTRDRRRGGPGAARRPARPRARRAGAARARGAAGPLAASRARGRADLGRRRARPVRHAARRSSSPGWRRWCAAVPPTTSGSRPRSRA